MTTQYKHSALIAVPESLISQANQLACLLGESAADINTFGQASWTDGTSKYAVANAAVKDVFLRPTQDGQLPPNPAHVLSEEGTAAFFDRSQAEAAFATLNQAGGILMAVDVKPMDQLEAWGLTRISTEDGL